MGFLSVGVTSVTGHTGPNKGVAAKPLFDNLSAISGGFKGGREPGTLGGLGGIRLTSISRFHRVPRNPELSNKMDDLIDDLVRIADRCERAARAFDDESLKKKYTSILEAAEYLGSAWSRSWIGYQAAIYTCDLNPAAGRAFDSEWGTMRTYGGSNQTRGEWCEFEYEAIKDEILSRARVKGVTDLEALSKATRKVFDECKSELLPILDAAIATSDDKTLKDTRATIGELESHMDQRQIVKAQIPKQIMSRDRIAMQGGIQCPPHILFHALIVEYVSSGVRAKELAKSARHASLYLQKRLKLKGKTVAKTDGAVFIGHGGSPVWRELKEFLSEKLKLKVEEFNSKPVAGRSTTERLQEMLDTCCFAFLVLTGEDESSDGKKHARQNVIHETGLFQGRYGFMRAIVLLEDGCEEFSNIHGLSQIRFPKGNIMAKTEEIRDVLVREGLIR